MTIRRHLSCLLLLLLLASNSVAEPPPDSHLLQPMDVFQLEVAADPQISPDGSRVAYMRQSMDVMSDRRRSKIWLVNTTGDQHRPLTEGDSSSPRWSPDGKRLAYLAPDDHGTQIKLRYMDSGDSAQLSRLTESPRGLAFSPDGRWIAFVMYIADPPEPFVSLPKAPAGSEWAPPPIYIDELIYRTDGDGYLERGWDQIFVLSTDGGTPRQLTSAPHDHNPPSWSADGKALYVAANRRTDADYDPQNNEIYRIELADGKVTQLTSRQGPDDAPVASPDGQWIAYLGFDDRHLGYQITRLYVLPVGGGEPRLLSAELDRDVRQPRWGNDSKSIYFAYEEHGNGKLARLTLDGGQIETLASNLGGSGLGRPYGGGSFSVADNGRLAYMLNRPDRPSEVAIAAAGTPQRSLTALNDDLLGHKKLGRVEEIWYPSSFDQRRIQGWIVHPPDFDENKKYPLILEIHGGPFANYGDRFAAELQLFAAAGYVVLYSNPRGSTSYGHEFGNLIHHNYPSQDYDDLMSGVDAVIDRGYVDPDNLFVTGGSGGGVLTAWVVGKTHRFKAAVSAKPVINWYSFVLTADMSPYFTQYWFAEMPWDDPEAYLKRSPLSLVGNVKTPTMLLTGEQDFRTPISESEQLYKALKLRKIDTALVRIPDASHGIAARPSHLMAKVLYVLEWFEKYRTDQAGD